MALASTDKLQEVDQLVRDRNTSPDDWFGRGQRRFINKAMTWNDDDPWFKEAQTYYLDRFQDEDEMALYEAWRGGTNVSDFDPKGRNGSCPECLEDEVFIPDHDYICKWCRNA